MNSEIAEQAMNQVKETHAEEAKQCLRDLENGVAGSKEAVVSFYRRVESELARHVGNPETDEDSEEEDSEEEEESDSDESVDEEELTIATACLRLVTNDINELDFVQRFVPDGMRQFHESSEPDYGDFPEGYEDYDGYIGSGDSEEEEEEEDGYELAKISDRSSFANVNEFMRYYFDFFDPIHGTLDNSSYKKKKIDLPIIERMHSPLFWIQDYFSKIEKTKSIHSFDSIKKGYFKSRKLCKMVKRTSGKCG
eukprot:TRINITY_DN461_c2_g1_i1.p1 TRINITY_DN461_c2_g1~~TRINITY_DN461_c2_g1_i1.p1  ORF type:complete len:252 (-),score=69.09 TRINITY_DN461_c2_g1_i1:1057-1812(-)